jgi:hypothetical protein
MTSGFATSTYCRAISSWAERFAVLAKKAAGLASVTWAVVTRPVALPAALARAPRVGSGLPSRATLIAPLYVRSPVAQAVAAAAESVTGVFGSRGLVVSCPETGSWSMVSRPSSPAR